MLRPVLVRALLTVAAGLLLAACGSSGPAGPSPSAIQGIEWRLVSLQRSDLSVVTIADPSRYTVQFGTDGRFSSRADCNRCSGTYTLSGSSLKLGPTACTLVACPVDSLGNDFAAALDSTRTASLDGSFLALSGSRGALRFTR